MAINRQIVLKTYCVGAPTPANFGMVESALPVPGPGEMLVRNLYFSLEPAIRGWLEGKANYFEPVPINGVVRGPSVARVVKSNLSGFDAGDVVFGLAQWEDYSVFDAQTVLLEKLHPHPGTPISYCVGALGGSGLTAYVGLHEVGRIKPGQTVVISAAAGATGGMAGQIAAIHGCKVIGIVGSEDKAKLITGQLGFHAAINYRESHDLAAAVTKAAPDGVDVYFDNVGGPTLNAMLLTMKTQGRIVACGMISDYNRTEDPNPITNLWQVVARQLTIQGFLLYSFSDALPAARASLNRWVSEGRIKVLEHITRGIANTPAAYAELMSGKTVGKALVELDLPEANG
jgi:NADPH-dependent curcumin reductase CurA